MKRILIIFLLFSLFGCQKLNEELDKVSGDIDQLEEQTIATINEQTTSINQDISALHSVQAAFQGEISSLKKDVAELETTMQTLRNERSRLLGEIEKLEEDAASIREDISDASNNINNHITWQGISLPHAARAAFTAKGRPPQQGTCILVTVMERILLRRKISVSFSA